MYSIGIFHNPQLIVESKCLFSYVLVDGDVEIKIKCNIKTNSITYLKRKKYKNIIVQIRKNIIKQLNENGFRWEGDWCHEKPFGFGSVYDGDGNRVYTGFMFKGQKVGFGTEYFTDVYRVDYCGYFMNDKRHGWGTTYDRNGNVLYEGEWRCGKNDFEDVVHIKDNSEKDCLVIHDLIKELVIGENCLNEWKDDLVIENYPNLEKIIVKKNSLKKLKSLKICNCEKLKTIEIEDGAFLFEEYDN